VQAIIKELLEKLPEEINAEEVAEKINPQDESNPLKVVLMQEISRYNKILRFVKSSL
jgi:dynein heavy chain